MKESPRQGTGTTRPPTARALMSLSKGALLDVRDMAVDLASEVADGYRKSTRYFKLRIAVVGTWILLLGVTMWLACPGGQGNALGADVQVQETLLGTQIKVENRSDQMWTDVVLLLDDEWERQVSTLREGQRQVFATSSFTRNGMAAPGDLKPRTLTIRCAQGKVTTTLAGSTP